MSLLLLLGVYSVDAQQTKNDSIFSEEEDLIALPEDTISYSQDFVPGDIIFIPSDVLYNNSWDNVYVRQKREDLTAMEDTIEIILNHPSESPFIFPKTGKFLSPFGYRGRHFHAGVDVKLALGDSIVAAWDGKVRLAKKYRGYGNIVVIRHYNGLETVYSHLSRILVSVNQDVKAGDLVGLGGRTGRATTNHLHFETRFLGEPFDPATFIDFETFTLKSDTLRITGSLFERGSKSKKGKNTIQTKTSAATADSEVAQYHIIRKGDTLAKISKRYNTTVKNLCKLNKITTRTILKPGRRLKLN
ncbi:MAG: peptidoglycan DD-metalloendopeptidase family protein [Bacteroidales bacterium]